ncbi:MAG: hypothetical protein J6N54_06415, partial [Bacteroidales bacterium]|nr:hypothetical protein [Bacteroidales bacterium]
DSVKFNAVATRFNGMPALGSVTEFTKASENNAVSVSATDITGNIGNYSSGVPSAISVSGDLTNGEDGSYNLSVKGATKKVLVYKPADYLGLSACNGHNIELTGIYYGESDDVITVIATSITDNGLSINEGDQVTVARFIELAKTDMKFKLVGTVSGYNQSTCRFDITDNTGSIYVYDVSNKSDWASKIKNGGTVELLGKYQYYDVKSQHEVVEAEILSFKGADSSTGYSYQKATSVTSGKTYIIAALSGTTAYVASPVASNKTYDWLRPVEATDENGVITLSSKENEFVFTDNGGSYTIAQPDGRLLYQTGTFDSFNVDASPSNGQYWTVESENDGTFTITNDSVDKFIQFSVTHNSYGSYDSTQDGSLMPCLYEYVGETTIEPGGDEPGGDNPGSGSEVDGDVETLDFAAQGFENGEQYPTVEGEIMTVTFGDGGNNGKYYDTGTAMRIYGGGYVEISASKTIVKIVYTFATTKGHSPVDDYTVNTGSFTSGTTATWTGSATSVKLTRDSGSGHWRLQKVEVTYAE